jgi:hypothetical protein
MNTIEVTLDRTGLDRPMWNIARNEKWIGSVWFYGHYWYWPRNKSDTLGIPVTDENATLDSVIDQCVADYDLKTFVST